MTSSTFNQSPQTFANEELPKVIHFIWIGGPIPEKYLDTVLKLGEIAKRDGFELNLWTDNPKNIEKPLEKKYSKLDVELRNTKDEFISPRFGVQIRQIDELIPMFTGDKENDEITRELTRIIREEMVGNVNYGAASDILRYFILFRDGGLYLDTDTIVNVDEKTILKSHSLPLGFRANMVAISSTGSFDTFQGGNDIIQSVPGHPILLEVIIDILNSYTEIRSSANSSANTNKSEVPLSAYDRKRLPANFEDSTRVSDTVTITGPTALLFRAQQYFEMLVKLFPQMNIYEMSNSMTLEKGGNSKVFGLEVTSASDASWLKTKRTTKKPSFVAESISPTLFGHTKRAENVKDQINEITSDNKSTPRKK